MSKIKLQKALCLSLFKDYQQTLASSIVSSIYFNIVTIFFGHGISHLILAKSSIVIERSKESLFSVMLDGTTTLPHTTPASKAPSWKPLSP